MQHMRAVLELCTDLGNPKLPVGIASSRTHAHARDAPEGSRSVLWPMPREKFAWLRGALRELAPARLLLIVP
jgi:hypothetical protein